jgi:hypothetical protein
MKRRKNSKRNLLVRFIRWVYKSLDTLFKRKKSTFRSLDRHKISAQDRDISPRSAPLVNQAHERDISPRSAPLPNQAHERDISRSAQSANRANEQLITVGELFDRVRWQFSEEDIQANILNLNNIPRPHDVSNN